MSCKVLVVEDEKAISDIIAFNLKREGFEIICAYDGKKGHEMALSEDPDIILLDIMLPGMDGFEVCKRIRKKSEVPIIMLTAREEETDKIFGLEVGADDYMTKPFSMRELVARIHANTRRMPRTTDREETKGADLGETKQGISINHEKYEVSKDGRILDLTNREYEIICFLAKEPGAIVSRESLMEKVWGYEYYDDLRSVDVAICRLREKIEDNPAEPKHIITKRGIGYYIVMQ